MESEYPVIETIERRRSVRTYREQSVASELLSKVENYAKRLQNPFGANVLIRIAHKNTAAKAEKLGTYGIIKGASTFLGLCVAPGDYALLGAGYEFEDLVLYATYLDLGTVWLAATFSRDKFQKAMDIPADYLFPAISPLGYPLEKRLLERIMRKAIGSDNRKPWKDLFFDDNFGKPLTAAEAGVFATPLEMMRLAPSATNAQPWRVLRVGDTVHFFETHKENARTQDVLIKQVDMGIGIFHFHKTLQSQGLDGKFLSSAPTFSAIPPDYHYVISFVLSPQ